MDGKHIDGKDKRKTSDEGEDTSGLNNNSNTTDSIKKLRRIKSGAVVAGICTGLGEYFQIDPVVIRLLFVIATVFGGYGLLVYIILWIILPADDSPYLTEETIRRNMDEIKVKTKYAASKIKRTEMPAVPNQKNNLAIIFIIIGAGVLLHDAGWLRFHLFWPLALICAGLYLILKK